jgi:hypothetical protein
VSPRHLLAALAAIVLAGCSTTAPNYSAGVDNVNAAGALRGSIAVGKFELAKGREAELNSIGARSTTFTSPVNGSYADYLAEAAKADLRASGKLDPSSPKVLAGVIEKNALSAAGIVTNDAEVAVRFTLKQGNNVTYEKLVTASHSWESSFMGGIAIPRAIQNYVVTVQKLLKQLYLDPDFASSTGR